MKKNIESKPIGYIQPENYNFLLDYNATLLKQNTTLKLNITQVFSGYAGLTEWTEHEFTDI